jgi:hypothetical protein
MRWGIEVEFRGLKQTIDKHKLRCRNSDRVLVELDWSIRAMAVAELLALREQIPQEQEPDADDAYDPKDRSLANTMRALRQCMRNLNKYPQPSDGLSYRLSQSLVQKYQNHTGKKARYRPKNPDKKPLGDPEIRKMSLHERRILREIKLKLVHPAEAYCGLQKCGHAVPICFSSKKFKSEKAACPQVCYTMHSAYVNTLI